MSEPRSRRTDARGDGVGSGWQNQQTPRGPLPAKPVQANDSVESVVPPIVHEALGSSGQPLDPGTRRFMEPRFGHDFSKVRVHTDACAAEAASAIAARAFTAGRDIVFGAGEYAPQADSGRRLLSHELTHVLQQGAGVPLRTAGSVIQRQPITTPKTPGVSPAPTKPLPSADELTTRIARCIGIWETNRGGNDPAPTESRLDTVAGVHASMATIEQATIPYAITALKTYKELRDKATPPLTMKELNDADARAAAVTKLLGLVAGASAAGTKPDAFIAANADAIAATGLSDADVTTMFSAVTLKATIDTLHADVTAQKKAPNKKTADEAVASIPAADRLGLGKGSLKTYISRPATWGENRAGWQRKAVAAMPGKVGDRIQQVAVSGNGTALAIPVIRARVNAELGKYAAAPTVEEIVKAVAQQNNPKEKGYGKHVWEIYDRLYP